MAGLKFLVLLVPLCLGKGENGVEDAPLGKSLLSADARLGKSLLNTFPFNARAGPELGSVAHKSNKFIYLLDRS